MFNLNPNTNQGPTIIIIVSVVFSVLAALAVALRFYARRVKGLRHGADNYVLLPAPLFTVGVCADGNVGAIYGGIGQHIQALTPHTVTIYQQIMYALQILYTLTLPLIKLSTLLLYRRMFSTPSFNRYENNPFEQLPPPATRHTLATSSTTPYNPTIPTPPHSLHQSPNPYPKPQHHDLTYLQ